VAPKKAGNFNDPLVIQEIVNERVGRLVTVNATFHDK
jgi:hypothetical protein